ncbi:MAG: LptA/OstA family protein, partial [Verrucomicrobiota bacterium]
MPLRPFSPLRLALCLLLLLAAVAGAQEPQLSADQPISADLNSGELVALGNARFENEDLVVEAEEIRFNQDSRTITATGNVRVTQPGMRLVSERVTYNIDSGAFTSGPFRAGLPPIFARGQAFEGTLEDLSLQEVNLYYLEPDPASPALSFEEARLDPNDRLRGTGDGLQLPFVGRLPL